MRIWFLRILLLVGTLLVILVVLEIGVRLAKDTSLAIIEPDPYITRKTKPNVDIYLNADGGGKAQVKTNKYGFVADYDWSISKPAGVFRIANLGDSFTAGHDVNYDENYTVQLASDFGELTGKKMESLNFAVPGQGTGHQLATYEHYARQFTPDAVIVWFFLGNDFEDNLVHEEGAEVGDNPREPWLKRVARQSELAVWTVNRLARVPFFAKLMYGRILTRVGEDTLGGEGGLPLSLRLVFTDDPENNKAISQTRKYLSQLRDEVAADSAKLIVVSAPAHFQVQRNFEDKLLEQYPVLTEVSFDVSRPNAELANLSRELGVEYFDLTPGFRATCENEKASCSLYLCPHCHPSVAGHKRVSELVAPVLAEKWFKD